MSNLQTHTHNYLEYCKCQKRLDVKTLKAYKIDLTQFSVQLTNMDVLDITPSVLENYISELHQKYKPKTVKRKIASIKAFFHYLECKDIIIQNPFSKIQVKFREPVILPKTIPLNTVEMLLSTIYKQCSDAKTDYQKKHALRDAAVIELLFATGIRISELCSLKMNDINLYDGTILIYGKGSKERKLQIGNDDVIHILEKYKKNFLAIIQSTNHFFVNQSGKGKIGRIAPNRIRRRFNTSIPHQKITTDTTEFKYYEVDSQGRMTMHKLYLDPFMDMCNGEILSFGIAKQPTAKNVMDALEQAIEKTADCPYRRTFHSDQGWAYQMKSYSKRLKEERIFQSMSRKGNCHDNSVMENFFGLLKQEIYYGVVYYSYEELKSEIERYIKYYNEQRIKEKLGWMSPVQYRLSLLAA